MSFTLGMPVSEKGEARLQIRNTLRYRFPDDREFCSEVIMHDQIAHTLHLDPGDFRVLL
jgi:hypothetical protein